MQSELAMEAYNEIWAGLPYSVYTWMVVIVIFGIIALYQARAFVTKF